MLARGEANPAVSINEPSLEAALISGCTGAVLFTTAPSLTLLIPNGFGLTRGSTSRGIMWSYFTVCAAGWNEPFLTLVISWKWMCLCWVPLKKRLRVYHPGPRMKIKIKVCENVFVKINHCIVWLYQRGGGVRGFKPGLWWSRSWQNNDYEVIFTVGGGDHPGDKNMTLWCL